MGEKSRVCLHLKSKLSLVRPGVRQQLYMDIYTHIRALKLANWCSSRACFEGERERENELEQMIDDQQMN